MSLAETTIELPDTRAEMDWKDKPDPLLDVFAWMPSEIKAINPLVDRLLQSVEESRCLPGDDRLLEVGLREALYKAVVHGDGLNSDKLIQVRCRCERENEIYIVVKDQERESASKRVPNPLVARSLPAEHGPGILQMKHWMDSLWFEQRGAEVHVWIGNHTPGANEIAMRERGQPSPPAQQGSTSRSWYSEAISPSRRTGD
jgi:anti-sigma regulatory factor (Ser/Thr protein kinase)